MITQDTAQRIDDICDEISACKNALELFKGEKPPELDLVTENEKGETTAIFFTKEIAEEAVEKQLKVLEAERIALNEKAYKEAKTVVSSD